MLGEQRRDALISGYRMQQKSRFQSITEQMLISIGDSTLKVKSSQKQHVYKILKLMTGKGKSTKSGKRTRKAQIKERTQFLMRD